MKAAKENGTNVLHEKLSGEIVVQQPGYAYIYFSNDNGQPLEVFFDDFTVEHVHSAIVQADDYYPFGMTFNEYRRENSVANKWKFQGQEHIEDLGLNWVSFKWRNHQPDIGRFFNIDPLASDYVHNSTYAFSENKVTNHIELEGLEAVSAQLEVRGLTGGKVGITTSHSAGIMVGRSSNGPGVHIAGFYTPTLGIGGGQGLTAGVSMSFYPTASIENLGGFGAAAGYFLTDNPVGLGPVFAGELNSTDPVQANVNFGGTIGINPLSIGAGGGIYGELTYTFLSDVVKIADLADNALVQQLSETFGVSKDVIIQGINSLSGELGNLTESYRSQMLNTGEFDLSKGYIAPSDNTRVAIPQRIIIDEEIKQ